MQLPVLQRTLQDFRELEHPPGISNIAKELRDTTLEKEAIPQNQSFWKTENIGVYFLDSTPNEIPLKNFSSNLKVSKCSRKICRFLEIINLSKCITERICACMSVLLIEETCRKY